jgi:hypothetical protein
VINDAHLHLVLNHLPIVGAALVMLLLVIGLARRSEELTRVALAFTVLIALGTIPAYLSGEGAEEIVEHDDQVAGDRIERHEERAEQAAIAVWVAGGLALIALLVGRGGRRVPRWATLGTLAVLIVSNGLLIRAGEAGGKISHPETRPGFEAPDEHRHGPGEGHEAAPADEGAGALPEGAEERAAGDRAAGEEKSHARDQARGHDHGENHRD